MKFIAYVAILLVTAAGLALGLDLLTAPPKKLEVNAARPAAEDVRQIPIKRATAQENGDPNNQLTPVYPAAPGKDLPVKDTPVQAAKAAPIAPPQTSGSAPAREAFAPPPAATVNVTKPAAPVNASIPATAAAGSCNIQACAATYRSFRPADCSYQPYDGPRQFCDAGQGGADQAAATPSAPSAQARVPAARYEPSAQSSKTQDQKDLEAAIRTVRSLPPPGSRPSYDERDYVAEEPVYRERTLPRQRWIIEQR